MRSVSNWVGARRRSSRSRRPSAAGRRRPAARPRSRRSWPPGHRASGTARRRWPRRPRRCSPAGRRGRKRSARSTGSGGSLTTSLSRPQSSTISRCSKAWRYSRSARSGPRRRQGRCRAPARVRASSSPEGRADRFRTRPHAVADGYQHDPRRRLRRTDRTEPGPPETTAGEQRLRRGPSVGPRRPRDPVHDRLRVTDRYPSSTWPSPGRWESERRRSRAANERCSQRSRPS